MTMTMQMPTQHVEPAADRDAPSKGVKVAYLVALALGLLALIAMLTAPASPRPSAPTDEGGFLPASELLPIPAQVEPAVIDEAPAVQPQVARPQVARPPARRVGPSDPAADSGATAGTGSATRGGGDTDVTMDNGTSDSETSSGGSHVNNDAQVHSSASVNSEEPSSDEDESPPEP